MFWFDWNAILVDGWFNMVMAKQDIFETRKAFDC